ncbi:T9SS type A sorting domain-containing protein [candidate division KSB1 bacterium]|nr:T9SS type A sorting domain-containing protein [candidate division KSB1 bacterium]
MRKNSYFMLALLSLFLLSMAGFAMDPPIAHWRLDETEGATVLDAIGSRHGAWVGTVAWQPDAGRYGGAMQCEDDSSFIEIDDSDMSLFEELGNEFTVSVWISVFEFTADWQGIVFKNNRFFLERNSSTSNGTVNGIHFKVKDETGETSAQPFNLYGDIVIDDGGWHHVVGIYDYSKAYLYVDAQLDKEGDATGEFVGLIADPLLIGAKMEDTYRNSWNGLIDDVKFFNYALSAEQVDSLFNLEYTGIQKKYDPTPRHFSLGANYPNPFNPSTTIAFDIAAEQFVTLTVFNAEGRQIRTLLSEKKAPGSHVATWDGCDESNQQMSSGVYLYKLTADRFSQTRKMLLVR